MPHLCFPFFTPFFLPQCQGMRMLFLRLLRIYSTSQTSAIINNTELNLALDIFPYLARGYGSHWSCGRNHPAFIHRLSKTSSTKRDISGEFQTKISNPRLNLRAIMPPRRGDSITTGSNSLQLANFERRVIKIQTSNLSNFHQEEDVLPAVMKACPYPILTDQFVNAKSTCAQPSFQLKLPFYQPNIQQICSMSTASSKTSKSSKRIYKKISPKNRSQLVQKVISQGLTISKAAAALKIALSTAKLIVKRYRQTGTYFLRRDDKKRLNKVIGDAQNEAGPLFRGPEVTSPAENGNPTAEMQVESLAPMESMVMPVSYYWQPATSLDGFCFYIWSIY